MSFMFHPHSFKDPRAVNTIPSNVFAEEEVTYGVLNFAKRLRKAIAAGARCIGLDGYAGAALYQLKDALCGQIPGLEVFDIAECYLPANVIREAIAPSLPEDRSLDPVLLYGVRLERKYEDLMDNGKLEMLVEKLASAATPILVVGFGSLCERLLSSYDLRVWGDITPRQAAINFKQGEAHNLGERNALPFSEMMRRNYYVDFELAIDRRWQMIRNNQIDWYLSMDSVRDLVMLPYSVLCDVFELLRQKPLRCRPVYLEGVWGGFYMKRLRHLPDEMRNCAWIFDMIPMEVSLVAIINGKELEVPFFTFIQQQGEKLLGRDVFEAFGGYFPLRFNYDDTFHSGGNMSIQCHPGHDYLTENHHELGRQDESYYVCVAGEGACTYLGFEKEESGDLFLNDAQRAVQTQELIPYQQYVHKVPSIPGTQVMIPAGTIHASGHNQVILEIGSLTVGSYTYKLYDYQRIDPQTSLQRPIHLEAGKKVLCKERTADWVEENLVNHGNVLRNTQEGCETIVGEHDLLYFSLRTLRFEKKMTDDTRGKFHVLTLTEGERVRVESCTSPDRYFVAQYLDILVIPADFGVYHLVNEGIGMVTVHKTMVKDGFNAI